MKLFWAIVALLAIGAAAVMFWPTKIYEAEATHISGEPRSVGSAPDATAVPRATSSANAHAAQPAATIPAMVEPGKVNQEGEEASPAEVPAPDATNPAPVESVNDAAPMEPSPIAETQEESAADADTTDTATETPLEEAPATGGAATTTETPAPDAIASAIAEKALEELGLMDPAAPVIPAPAPTETSAPAPSDAAATAPLKVEPLEGGSLRVADRFTITGAGTAAEPYVIPWEFLVATSETYKPRVGQKKLPAWLDLINNKQVKITGYVAFPIMAQEQNEMLLMLNQWDGCCIGVPPTPYDAVEVKLSKGVSGENRLAAYGSVTGKFKVDPYLVKDWLIGLYTMEDAVLAREE
ncbi:MAG: DUF3299 domain-containing protein [Phycisphaerales bacterium]|nr:DUF3299 domain-containing protein [Phycisphaerales bacterium]